MDDEGEPSCRGCFREEINTNKQRRGNRAAGDRERGWTGVEGRGWQRGGSGRGARQGREKLAMTADVIGSGAIRRDDGCLTGAPRSLRSLARQL